MGGNYPRSCRRTLAYLPGIKLDVAQLLADLIEIVIRVNVAWALAVPLLTRAAEKHTLAVPQSASECDVSLGLRDPTHAAIETQRTDFRGTSLWQNA
jgi:hypothetical protein